MAAIATKNSHQCLKEFMERWSFTPQKSVIGTIIGFFIAAAIIPAICAESERRDTNTRYGNPTDPVVMKVRSMDIKARHARQFKFDNPRVNNHNYRSYRPEVQTLRELNH